MSGLPSAAIASAVTPSPETKTCVAPSRLYRAESSASPVWPICTAVGFRLISIGYESFVCPQAALPRHTRTTSGHQRVRTGSMRFSQAGQTGGKVPTPGRAGTSSLTWGAGSVSLWRRCAGDVQTGERGHASGTRLASSTARGRRIRPAAGGMFTAAEIAAIQAVLADALRIDTTDDSPVRHKQGAVVCRSEYPGIGSRAGATGAPGGNCHLRAKRARQRCRDWSGGCSSTSRPSGRGPCRGTRTCRSRRLLASARARGIPRSG